MIDRNRLLAAIRGSAASRAAGELPSVPGPDLGLSTPAPESIAGALGADVVRTRLGPCVVAERTYKPHRTCGRVTVSECAGVHPESFRLLAGAAPGDGALVFLDLETTGLSGGAGTVAFLVGLGFFENEHFCTRQFFLPSFAAERALLEAVTLAAEPAGAVVTYNGKAFDLPVMETRWAFHRLALPLAEKPHLDMLHPARRLWGPRDCSLQALEQAVLGFVRDEDVPRAEIPARYFQYLRTGDVGPLLPVLEHNRRDLLSLAALTARACGLIEAGLQATPTARESLALGRLYERAGRPVWAEKCYRRAAASSEAGGDRDDVRVEALYHLALLCRHDRRHREAAEVWQQILRLDARAPLVEREAWTALAVHHEHRVRDLETARGCAERALTAALTARRREEIRHRLARLGRKMAVQRNSHSPAALRRGGIRDLGFGIRED